MENKNFLEQEASERFRIGTAFTISAIALSIAAMAKIHCAAPQTNHTPPPSAETSPAPEESTKPQMTFWEKIAEETREAARKLTPSLE